MASILTIHDRQKFQNYRATITITKCIVPDCNGFYTYTFSGDYLVICNDPRHNKKEKDGLRGPTAEDDGVSLSHVNGSGYR